MAVTLQAGTITDLLNASTGNGMSYITVAQEVCSSTADVPALLMLCAMGNFKKQITKVLFKLLVKN